MMYNQKQRKFFIFIVGLVILIIVVAVLGVNIMQFNQSSHPFRQPTRTKQVLRNDQQKRQENIKNNQNQSGFTAKNSVRNIWDGINDGLFNYIIGEKPSDEYISKWFVGGSRNSTYKQLRKKGIAIMEILPKQNNQFNYIRAFDYHENGGTIHFKVIYNIIIGGGFKHRIEISNWVAHTDTKNKEVKKVISMNEDKRSIKSYYKTYRGKQSHINPYA